MFVAQPGLIVGNRYSLTHVIGRGGMGEVWKAHDRELDTACAVKFILQHLASDRGIRERFTREAKAVARLRSPHVVHILGVGEIESVPYLAMELLDGETLLARLERIGRMHPAVTLKMLEQVAEALESAHQAGIVHRDLKPDNIWFWSGNKVFVKVLDFGVAKTGMTTESLQTATGALVGTPQYMSPEQALGNRDIDHRSDLWSLAVIAMECLSGKRPFESSGLGDLLMKIVGAAPPACRELAPDLPAGVQEWWVKALARDPRDRFQSATELVEGLRACFAALETDAAQGGESGRSRMLVPDTALPERGVENATGGRVGGVPHAQGSSAASVADRSPRLEIIDSLAAESAPSRAPGSVGPISSSRSPQRRGSRQRTLLIAGGLVAAAVLATLGRLFLAAAPEEGSVTAARAAAPAAPSSPAAVLADPVKPAPPSSGPGVAAPSATAGERSPLGQQSPWEPALRGNKPGEPSTTTQALQPLAGNPAEPRIRPATADAPARPVADPASRMNSVNSAAALNSAATSAGASADSASPAASGAAATAKPASSAKLPPKPPESAVKAPTEAAHAAPAPHEATVESDAARKERLRKATGL